MYSAPRFYYVYIMTNRSKTLYTGVTGNLEKRVLEHKQGTKGEFAARYKIDRLVYFELSETCALRLDGRSRSRDGFASRRSGLLCP
jgi:predicted GIY-YIG superfamily endonuclease